MISLKQILNEDVNLYQGTAILENDPNVSQKDIFNKLRALNNVIVVTPIHDDYLYSKKTEFKEYALIKIKFINSGRPEEDMQQIRHLALEGEKKIKGLKQFIIRPQTLKSIKR
jgi:RNase P/RNase MRP subunit p30